METCVLIPQEFSLTLTTYPNKNSAEITVWSIADIAQGTLFHPFQGTVRLDRMDNFICLKDDDVRYRFGLYDEISYIFGRRVRHCNWIRFLRVANTYDTSVNMVCTRVKGEPLYEIIKPIGMHTELVVFYLPERREDQFLEHRRSTWFRQTMDSILEESPLDLSMSLMHRASLPISPVSNSEDEHKSITSESSARSTTSSNENINDILINDSLSSRMTKYQTPKTSTRAGRGERTYLPCEVCGKAFDRPSLLKRHMRTHTGEKPHVCMVCSKGFSTSSSLNTHRRIHSGEKPHECQVCGKRFTASSNLYYHRMTHVKDKPHKCNLCSKSFPTPGDLKSHMYVHSGTWPFKCHICFRGFSKQTNLKNHLFLHTGDKPHGCELCNKKFALACNLRAHMKTHEGDPQDECMQCGKVFVTTAANTRQQQSLCSRCNGGSNSNGGGSTDDLTDADADVEKTGFHADESTGDESSNVGTEYSDK